MGKIYITREDYKSRVAELEAELSEALKDDEAPEPADLKTCECPTCTTIRKQRDTETETIEEILALAGR